MKKTEEVKVDELSKDDYKLITEIIELCSKNGSFQAKDLLVVGALFNKVEKLCQ